MDPAALRSNALPGDFASFSLETPCARDYVWKADGSLRLPYINIMKFLRDVGGGPGPNIRIGGNSVDQSFYTTNSSNPLPSGNKYAITPHDIESFAAARLWNGSVVLGVNLLRYDEANTREYIDAAVRGIPAGILEAIELGNEPDIYYYENGVRTQPYTYANYSKQIDSFSMTLQKMGVGMPLLQGPTTCCTDFQKSISSFISTFGCGTTRILRAVSHHHYPLPSSCKLNSTIEQLMADRTSDLSKFSAWAAQAAACGVPFRIGEGNSVACGTMRGVTNTFANALWSVDTLFNAAANNITRWNFHGCWWPWDDFTPIAVADMARGNLIVRPLFYGMWVFTHAIANNSRLVNATVVTSTEKRIKAHATLNRNRVVVVLLHKGNESFDACDVTVTLLQPSDGPSYRGRYVKIRRLLTKGGAINATSGLTYDGMTFDGTMDGYPTGSSANEVTTVSERSSFRVSVAPASVVVCEIAISEEVTPTCQPPSTTAHPSNAASTTGYPLTFLFLCFLTFALW